MESTQIDDPLTKLGDHDCDEEDVLLFSNMALIVSLATDMQQLNIEDEDDENDCE